MALVRRRIARILAKNPGLESALPEALKEAFENARDRALDETALPEAALPLSCPYDWHGIMDREIAWPEVATAAPDRSR